jgi:hypothetical protein
MTSSGARTAATMASQVPGQLAAEAGRHRLPVGGGDAVHRVLHILAGPGRVGLPLPADQPGVGLDPVGQGHGRGPAQAVADQQVDRPPEPAGDPSTSMSRSSGRADPGQSPWPGRSGASTTQPRSARAGPVRHQVAAVDILPCSGTTRPRRAPNAGSRHE